MKIAFFGKEGSFDYGHIGGTNSLTRRLAKELVEVHGHSVDFIFYGLQTKNISHAQNINSYYYTNYSDALSSLLNYDHVILIYVSIKDIFKLYAFCNNNTDKVIFHHLYQDWPESFIMRNLMFWIKDIIPINGFKIGISERIVERLSENAQKHIKLYPPVPNNFFKKNDNINNLTKINITFIGRIDEGKGILETIEIFEKLSEYPMFKINLFGIHWKSDSNAIKIHEKLKAQSKFHYYPVDFYNHSPQVDEIVRGALFNTDIFLQPYRKLSSTIDTPLLILEAMAALCAVITKPYGNIPDIYGPSPCLIDDQDFVNEAINLILQSEKWLYAEKERIHSQNIRLKFDLTSVGNRFVNDILDNSKAGV